MEKYVIHTHTHTHTHTHARARARARNASDPSSTPGRSNIFHNKFITVF